MLNRNIPIYEGNLPYLYACYSPEDEMLVLPILTRMYNEGFRFWSASLVEKVSDFVAVRHVSTSACVVMFMSHSMMERINAGIPEVLAACRSSLLRSVVLLDDANPDNRIFALTSPERVEYRRSNDAGFWLYAYSVDYLERCRGPWPEVKLDIHEPAYEDVQEEAIAAEYISLENIISRGGTEPEAVAPKEQYPNNRGYIPPKPDQLTYEPLGKVEAARTVHDRDFDDAISLLNQCAEKQIDIIISHTRPGENTVPAKPALSPISPLADKQAEMDTIRRELEASAVPAERPERRVDPEVRTKADMVVEPEEKVQPEEIETKQAEEKIPQPIAYIPDPELTASSIAESIRQLTEAPAVQPVEQAAPEVAPQTAEEIPAEKEAEVTIAETVDVDPEDRSEAVSEYTKANAAGRSTVQVVVRKPQPAVRVTPVKKRVITESLSAPGQSRAERTKSGYGRSVPGGNARAAEEDTAALEKYIRDIALAAVSESVASAEEQPVSHRRFGRFSRTAESAEEAQVTASAVQTVETSLAEPVAVQAAVPAAESVDESAEKVSPRKNRHPHNSEGLTGLLAALRQSRAAGQTETEAEKASAREISLRVVPTADVPAQLAELHEEAESESDLKIIRLSDAISERKVTDLQTAVNKFMRAENKPEAAPVSVRAYLRRR